DLRTSAAWRRVGTAGERCQLAGKEFRAVGSAIRCGGPAVRRRSRALAHPIALCPEGTGLLELAAADHRLGAHPRARLDALALGVDPAALLQRQSASE